jgi:transcriptional regulator with XRE-family HTH domain
MTQLQQLRKEKHLRTTDIATQLGISQGHYSNMENGKRTISDDLLEKISRILGESRERVEAAAQQGRVDTLKLKSWLSNVRINGLPLVKAFRYHLEQVTLDPTTTSDADLKKELREFIEKNISFSLLAEFSENKRLIEQIRSKLCGENSIMKERELFHEQSEGNA